MLQHVGIEEELRGLDQGHLRVAEKPDHPAQEIALGYKIGVQHHDERRVGGFLRNRQGMVHVAGLGAFVAVATKVAHAEHGAFVAQPVAPGIVEHPEGEVGIIEGPGAKDAALQHLPGFIVGGDEDIDGRQVAAAAAGFFIKIGSRPVVAMPPEGQQAHEGAEGQHQFQRKEGEAEDEIRDLCGWRQGFRYPPVKIPQAQ